MSAPILPYSVADIILKVRKVTGRTRANQISDAEIVRYINTFYIFDFPEHLRLESLKYVYQFVTKAGIPVYDFPTSLYLTNSPIVTVAGYQVNFTQTRNNFYNFTSAPQFLQASLYTGNGTTGPYTGQILTNYPILPGFKPNPPGAFSTSPCQAKFINWNVLVSSTTSSGVSISLVDDGQGNLIDPEDAATPPSYPTIRGSVNYATGAVNINAVGFSQPVGSGNPINVQSTPVVWARPLTVAFFQDQFLIWPVPDQAYTVSVEAFKYPIPFNSDASLGEVVTNPQVREWWQALAYGAADKIFTDNGDVDSVQKFRPFLEEQLKLINRRTIVQQTTNSTPTIYNQNMPATYWGFGNGPYIF